MSSAVVLGLGLAAVGLIGMYVPVVMQFVPGFAVLTFPGRYGVRIAASVKANPFKMPNIPSLPIKMPDIPIPVCLMSCYPCVLSHCRAEVH